MYCKCHLFQTQFFLNLVIFLLLRCRRSLLVKTEQAKKKRKPIVLFSIFDLKKNIFLMCHQIRTHWCGFYSRSLTGFQSLPRILKRHHLHFVAPLCSGTWVTREVMCKLCGVRFFLFQPNAMRKKPQPACSVFVCCCCKAPAGGALWLSVMLLLFPAPVDSSVSSSSSPSCFLLFFLFDLSFFEPVPLSTSQ